MDCMANAADLLAIFDLLGFHVLFQIQVKHTQNTVE